MTTTHNIIIQRLEESPFSYSDVAVILHKAFEERVKQGIIMSPSKMNAADFKEKGDARIVLVAIIDNKLAGTAMTQLRVDQDGIPYGYEEFKGVLPVYKRKGIGSILEDNLQKIAIDSGMSYLISTTAVRARSSIKFHQSKGFFKWCLVSYPDTGYYSVVLRKQLRHDKKWDNILYRKFHYLLSFCQTVLNKRRDGNNRRWRRWF